MHWDVVFTCYEPITRVTGGIGTYMRLLLNKLGKEKGRELNILLISNNKADIDTAISLSIDCNIKTHFIDQAQNYNSFTIHHLGDEHSRYSFFAANYLSELYDNGHTFGLIECSDYGREAYFILKMRKHGRFNCRSIAIRLHSPDIMLYEDNKVSIDKLELGIVYKFEEEIYCYRNADIIFYGGDAMLERVNSDLEIYDIDLKKKAIKIWHPFNDTPRQIEDIDIEKNQKNSQYEMVQNLFQDRRKTTILYSGRLERRKGVYDFVATLMKDADLINEIYKNNVYFLFCGKDTHSFQGGGSVLSAIMDLIKGSLLEERLVFLGYVDQQTLYDLFLPNADAYIFPSLFENFPNAFIETLPYKKPTLVSDKGCMPEIGEAFSYVKSYNPLASNSVHDIKKFICNLREKAAKNDPDYYEFAQNSNRIMVEEYHKVIKNNVYSNKYQDASEKRDELSVSFVVPHYNNIKYLEDCLKSIFMSKKDGDEVIVVDDCTPLDIKQEEMLLDIIGRYNVKFIKHIENEGPSCARNSGARAATCDLIQFIDADDIIHKDGFNAARNSINLNRDIDMIYGLAQTFETNNHIWAPRDATASVFESNYTHSAILIRRDVFWEIDGFNEEMINHYEDWEINARFVLANKNAEMVPWVTFYYRNKPLSRTNTNLETEIYSRESVVDYASKWFFRHQKKAVSKTDEFIRKAAIYYINWQRAGRWISHLENTYSKHDAGNVDYKYQITNLENKIKNIENNYQSNIAAYKKLEMENRLLRARGGERLKIKVENINNMLLQLSKEKIYEILINSDKFDMNWYIKNNSDLASDEYFLEMPHEHYENHGWKEGRHPNPYIDGKILREVFSEILDGRELANPLIIYSYINMEDEHDLSDLFGANEIKIQDTAKI